MLTSMLVCIAITSASADATAEIKPVELSLTPVAYQQPATTAERAERPRPAQDDPWGLRDGRYGPRMGDWEFRFGGGGTTPHNFRSSTWNVDLALGHYVTDHLSIEFRQSINFTDVGGSNFRGASRGAVDWHFGDGRFRPFIGANFGGVYGDAGDSWLIGPEAGLKWFVHPQTFLFGLAEYQIFFDRIDDIDDNARRGDFVFSFGIGFLF